MLTGPSTLTATPEGSLKDHFLLHGGSSMAPDSRPELTLPATHVEALSYSMETGKVPYTATPAASVSVLSSDQYNKIAQAVAAHLSLTIRQWTEL